MWVQELLAALSETLAASQVHTGMHYPGHAVVGSLIGEGTRQAVGGLIDRLAPT